MQSLTEISDRFEVFRRQEEIYQPSDYLSQEFQERQARRVGQDRSLSIFSGLCVSPDGNSPSCASINDVWREKICEWSYEVIDHFDYNREIVAVSLSYLDRYLSTKPVNRKVFQLAAMTSLYLAIKLFEPTKMRMSSFIELSRGYFRAEHIAAMEEVVLRALQWQVHPPTPLTLVRHFMLILPDECKERKLQHEIKELARFLTELSVCDYYFVTKKPSSIAIAAILNAFSVMGENQIPSSARALFLKRIQDIAGYDPHCKEVQDCRQRLEETYYQGGFHECNLGLVEEEEEVKERCDSDSPICVSDISYSNMHYHSTGTTSHMTQATNIIVEPTNLSQEFQDFTSSRRDHSLQNTLIIDD